MDSIDKLLREGELRDLIYQMRATVEGSTEDELCEKLMGVILPAYGKIKKIRREVREDMERNGRVLREVMQYMKGILAPVEAERSLVVRSVCPPCTAKAERAADRKGRRKTHENEQPVIEHITKRILLSGNADQYITELATASLYPRGCGDCGGQLKILNSSNNIKVVNHPVVHMISGREKGSGRWAEKGTEAIFDPNSRSMLDWIAFYAVLDMKEMLTWPDNKIKSYVRKHYSGAQLDKGKGPYEDQMHFKLLEHIRRVSPFDISFKEGLDERGKTDNYIAYPKKRTGDDGGVDYYKGLHFDMSVRVLEDVDGRVTLLRKTDFRGGRELPPGVTIRNVGVEGQIKTMEIYNKENDPNSEIYHKFMEEQRADRIAAEWTDPHLMVFDILRKAVRRTPDMSCYCKK